MRMGRSLQVQLVPRFLRLCMVMFLFSLALNACMPLPAHKQDGKLLVVATTSLVGNVVHNIGGDRVTVEVLLPLGSDPHSFSPTPRDASKIADADIIFANGAGLEDFLKPLLESVGESSKVVEVSAGITLRSLIDEDAGSTKPGDDPHTWMDPNNVILWVDHIVQSLGEKDPGNASFYERNGKRYQDELSKLDSWIKSEVTLIPDQNRKLVTDHLVFGYFSDRYHFTQVGAIIPGFSSLAEPSAQDIAQIEDEISKMGVKAVFINVGQNANLAQRIASDTHTQIVFLYMHSLSAPGGAADNYLDFMRYDVAKIVEALK